ncbi:MAG: glycine zipper family protein, partial [Deltaproteobacteria bacterium]|nr:glycine zipper family protein [Deltaproteobacteria bacterium]
GATAGGAAAVGSNRASQDISDDLRNKSLESRPIQPLEIVHGFIFFPGEASSAKELRLQIREIGTGRFLNISLPL